MPYTLVADIDIGRVDEEDRGGRRRIAVQSRRRINAQGTSHNQKDISPGDNVDGLADFRDRLPEPDYMRAELDTVRGLVSKENLTIADVEHLRLGEAVILIAAVLRTDLGKLAVKMQDAGAACALVEIVHILGYDIDIVPILQGGDGQVGCIGLTSASSFLRIL